VVVTISAKSRIVPAVNVPMLKVSPGAVVVVRKERNAAVDENQAVVARVRTHEGDQDFTAAGDGVVAEARKSGRRRQQARQSQ
jgi:hypothetical protein